MKSNLQTSEKAVCLSTTHNAQRTNLTLLIILFLFIGTITKTFAQPIVIQNNTNWNPSSLPSSDYKDGIQVFSGATLTIENLTLLFTDNAFFSIFPGGHVIIKSCTLTSNTNWQGIDVEGYSNLEQFSTFPNPGIFNNINTFEGVLNNNQTSLIIENSSIQFSNYAFHSTNGGIVRVRNSEFGNIAYHYGKFDPYLSNIAPFVNASYIIDSDLYGEANFQSFIKINGNNGIYLGGISISNSNDDYRLCNRGVGIECINSNIVISTGGNVFCKETGGLACDTFLCGGRSTNEFDRLSNAIVFKKEPIFNTAGIQTNVNTSYKTIIRNSIFSDCMNSITLDDYSYSRIFKCEFNNSAATNIESYRQYPLSASCHNIDDIIDINIIGNTRGIKIIENLFEYNSFSDPNLPNDEYTRGIIHINVDGNDDWKSHIHNNRFLNTSSNNNINSDMVTAIKVNGTTNYEITCNEFDNIGSCIYIVSGKINSQQGSPQETANNTFPTQLSGRFRLNNLNGQPITYFHTSNSPNPNNIKDPLTTGYTSLQMKLNYNIGVFKETQCIMTCAKFLTKIEKIDGVNSIKIYPNPTNDFLIINSNKDDIISIYDLMGRLISHFNVLENEDMIINLSNYNKGIYIIRNQNNSINKFIIN
ncbi:MAG: T9SS type A sorting domain-containing protein [Bacteroidota bacterium]|nr:T9SS type A sorting domain-containing protein [Bacteroidota bacterium]